VLKKAEEGRGFSPAGPRPSAEIIENTGSVPFGGAEAPPFLGLFQHPARRYTDSGFTLLEVLIALTILVIGMSALAMFSARMMTGGTESKYMNLAASITSEKLEDLNRWSTADPQICVPTGSTSVGSLTSDVVQTTTCPGGAANSVNYFDDVTLANVTGAVSETVSSTSAGGTVYTTTTQTPNGEAPTVSTSSTPPTAATFHRRWIIEADSPIAGVRRVTVLVTLLDSSVKPPVTFQMSLVRP